MILDSIEWWRWRSLVDSIILSTHTTMLFLSWSIKMFNEYFFVLFRDTHSSVLEESLRKLGVEKLSKEDVQKMQWEVLEAKIGNWIHFMRIAISTCLEFVQIWQFSCSEYMVMHEQVKLLYAGEHLWSNIWRLWFSQESVFWWGHCKQCFSAT